jgi:AAA domain/Helix-hairpin-helix containing domain
VRIYKTYRDEAIDVVRREPYRLAAEVWGIGFKTADQIAQCLGIPHDSPERVKAGVQFALSQASDDGHCYLPEAKLLERATGLLGVDAELASRCLEELIEEEGVAAEPLPTTAGSADGPAGTVRAVYLVPFHRAEAALAAGLLRLLGAPGDRLNVFQTVNWTVALDWLGRTTGVTLAPEQQAAVRLTLTQRVAVLTGGPGCGKSYTVRAVVALARAKHAKVVLAAPTGRAAKRLEELAGLQAATLHRLLQLRPGGDAAFDRDHPLDADLVVADEASMLDLLLANKLVKAIPPGAHLLLVGDVDQLPSVGAGEVLRDLLAAESLPADAVLEHCQPSGPADPLGDDGGRHRRPRSQQLPNPRLHRIHDRPARRPLIAWRAIRSQRPLHRVLRAPHHPGDLLDRHLLGPAQPADLRPVLHGQHLAPSPTRLEPGSTRGQLSAEADSSDRRNVDGLIMSPRRGRSRRGCASPGPCEDDG